MKNSALDLITTVAFVVTTGVACIALLLYGDLRAEVDRHETTSGAPDAGGRRRSRYARAAGVALTVVFIVLVVVRFTTAR